MAHYRAATSVPAAPDQVFHYLANFAHSQEWDPGVVRAEAVTPPPIGSGSEFDVVTGSAGRTIHFRYRIVEFDPPRRVVLRGTSAHLTSTDAIEVAPLECGSSTITYDADLRLSGIWRVFDFLLSPAFQRIGDRAVGGLRSTLAPLVEHSS